MRIKYLIIFMCLFLVGCNKNQTFEKYEFSLINDTSIGTEDPDGYYYTKEGLLYYYDFDSKKSVVVCNKPGCDHAPYSSSTDEDKLCHAAIDYNSFLVVNNDYIYVIEPDTSSGLNHESVIVKSKKDRTDRKEVAKFKGNVYNVIAQVYESIYFTAGEPEMESESDGSSTMTQRNTSYIYEYNLNEDRLKTIDHTELMYSVDDTIIGKVDDGILVRRTYQKEKVEDGDYTKNLEQEILVIKDEEVIKKDIQLSGVGLNVKTIDNSIYIVVESDNTEGLYDIQRYENDAWSEVDTKVSNVNFIDDGFLYSKDDKYYFYSNSEKSISEIKKPARESFVYNSVRDFYVVVAQDNDGYSLALINKNDYVNGIDKYIFLGDN